MEVIALIEPPQGEVIETILRGHPSGAMVGGLWHAWRAPPGEDGGGHDPAEDSDHPTSTGHFLRLRYPKNRLVELTKTPPALRHCGVAAR